MCVVAVARPWTGEPSGLPADSVGLIGPSGGRVGGPVSVGNPAGLAYGDGSVWAVDSADGTLCPDRPGYPCRVQQIPVGSAPSAVAVTGPDAWVTNSFDGTVSRVSTVTNRVVDTIQVGNLPVAIAAGRGGVWVANEGDGTVDRIDPVTGDVTKRGIQVGARPDGIAAGPDAVWVANGEDGTVQRIDPATGQPGSPFHVGAGPEGIAVTPGAVWVANSLDLTVSKLDPATGTVTATVARRRRAEQHRRGRELTMGERRVRRHARTASTRRRRTSSARFTWEARRGAWRRPGPAYGLPRGRSPRPATAAAP